MDLNDEGTWLVGVQVAGIYTQDVTERRAGRGDAEEPAYRGQAEVGTSMTRAGSGRLRDIRPPSREALLRCRPTGTCGPAGATHRSRESDGLPLPGHAPFFPKPWAPTTNSPSVR